MASQKPSIVFLVVHSTHAWKGKPPYQFTTSFPKGFRPDNIPDPSQFSHQKRKEVVVEIQYSTHTEDWIIVLDGGFDDVVGWSQSQDEVIALATNDFDKTTDEARAQGKTVNEPTTEYDKNPMTKMTEVEIDGMRHWWDIVAYDINDSPVKGYGVESKATAEWNSKKQGKKPTRTGKKSSRKISA